MKPKDVSARAWDFAREQIESTALHDERAFMRRRRMARMFDKATADLRGLVEIGYGPLSADAATIRAYTPEDDDGQ